MSRKSTGAHEPPVFWRALVATILWGSRREVVQGDLQEVFHRRLADGMPASDARWRYRWDALASIWELLRSADLLRNEPVDGAVVPTTYASTRRGKGDSAMAAAWNDFRYSISSLARRPGLTLIVVLTLALGIGIGTTVFSVVESTLLRALPVRDPESLVMIWNRQAQEADASNLLSAPDFADLRQRARTLQSVGAFGEIIVAPVVGTDQPSFGRQVFVTADFFDMLGVEPRLGRLFRDADGVPPPEDSREPSIVPLVISHDYWVREFDGDENVVGRGLRTFTNQYQIVGVLPQRFKLVMPAAAEVDEDLGTAIDLWVPFRFDMTQATRNSRGFRVIGRRADGVGLADVRGELDAIATALRNEHDLHETNRFALGAESYVEASAAHLRPLLWLLGWAVACVLLVACINASGLMLARISERERELSVRAALGAGRWHLARLSLTEATLLATVGGLLGVVVARLGMSLIAWLSPAGLPQADQLTLNPRVLGFALLVAPFCAGLTGLLPVLRAMAHRRCDHLTARASTASRNQRRLREGLVAAQIALTVILLMAAGLLLRSFSELRSVPIGFETDRVLTLDISTVAGGWDRTAPDRDAALREWVVRRRGLEHNLSRALRQVPGIEASGAVFPVPLNGVYSRTCSYAPLVDGGDAAERVAYFRNVLPGYFDTLKIPLVTGRDFRYEDDPSGLLAWLEQPEVPTDRPTAIVDQRLAEKLWPAETALGQNAIGQILRYTTSGRVYFDAEVIGVVPFIPQVGLEDSRPTIYIPRSYYRSQELTLTMRVADDSPALRETLIETVHAHFPESPTLFRTLDDYVDKAAASDRFVLTLVGAFAVTALLLAAVGLYGTLALTVRQRATEIGIHIAMGAGPRRIFRDVVKRSLGLSAVGISIGLFLALFAAQVFKAYLYNVSGADPVALLGTIAVQVVVAIVACWIPAMRAARIDPIVALSSE